ncbi:MAG: hypothetical protein RIC80_18515 [Cyclobacteriaceae bacterium]
MPGTFIYLSYSGGPRVVPGDYKITLTSGQTTSTQTLTVKADPRWEVDQAGFEAQLALQIEVRDMVTDIHSTIADIRSIRDQLEGIDLGDNKEAVANVKAFQEAITGVEDQVIQTKTESHQDPINYPVQLDTHVGYLFSVAHSQEGRPNDAIYDRLEDLKKEWAAVKSDYDQLIGEDLKAIEDLLEELNIPYIHIPNR